jgi:Fur family peroxide stress response transcriptional regulator
MKPLKHSRQREALKAALMSRKDHPTADALYLSLREDYPNLSLGTVYRNLNLLVEMGEALRVDCGDGADRFDGDVNPHYHFICTSCGAVSDLYLDPLDLINQVAQAHCDGKVDGHQVYFHGTCAHCLGKRQRDGIPIAAASPSPATIPDVAACVDGALAM